MRGHDFEQEDLFDCTPTEARIPEDHPLRYIKQVVQELLADMSNDFAAMYADDGRPSIPPEKLLRALILQALYSVRSERQLMEQLQYNMLYRWFVGLSLNDPVWNASTFSKNRERLLEGNIAQKFLQAVVARAKSEGWMSQEHFTVDGTLLEAWAGHKSFVPREKADGDDNDDISDDFHGQTRRNDTHQSTTDPDARLFKKGRGKEAKLCHFGHALMENRNGLVVDVRVTQATGTAEVEAALEMLGKLPATKRVTLGADKGYDRADFVERTRSMKVTPHIAAKTKGSAMDERYTRSEGYQISQNKRKRIETIFGWAKTIGNMDKLKHRGTDKVSWVFAFTLGVYNLRRMEKLRLRPV